MNKFAATFIVFLFALLGSYFYFKPSESLFENTSKQREEIPGEVAPDNTKAEIADFTASFAIFTNGTFRIFSDKKYHNLSPDIFIQADNPNLIHIKKKRATWDDFFKTLPMKLTKDCLTTGTGQTFCTNQNQTLRFYMNGEKVDNILEKEIKPEDKLLISYGSEDEEKIKSQFQKLDSF